MGWDGEREREGKKSEMASGGDILMLEAPPLPPPSKPQASDIIIDSLPYIDEEYGDPTVKEEVDRFVEEEMRRSLKKPADFLKDLPPLPKFNYQVTPISFQRLRSNISLSSFLGFQKTRVRVRVLLGFLSL